MAQRLQGTDFKKIMNQLISVGVPDYGGKKRLRKTSGNGEERE